MGYLDYLGMAAISGNPLLAGVAASPGVAGGVNGSVDNPFGGGPDGNQTPARQFTPLGNGLVTDQNGNVLYQRADGSYYDPRSGETFSAGGVPFGGPTPAQLAARGVGVEDQLLRNYTETYGKQNDLGAVLQGAINGTAPSVARAQLAQSDADIARQQLGMSSGVGGNNALSARLNAADNIARNRMETERSAALIRAKEVADARGQYGQLLGDQSKSALGGAASYGDIITKGVAGEAARAEADTARKWDLAGKLLAPLAEGGAQAAGSFAVAA